MNKTSFSFVEDFLKKKLRKKRQVPKFTVGGKTRVWACSTNFSQVSKQVISVESFKRGSKEVVYSSIRFFNVGDILESR